MENLCNICPRNCGVDRSKTLGFCKGSNSVKLSKVMLHYFEEPIISGEDTPQQKAAGSGAVFFSNCTLKCVYCQNSEISHDNFGKNITIDRLADIMLELQNKGAHNINLVTPTHFVPSIIEAIKKAKTIGLTIPIVYNSSGYESEETIKLLDGIIDIYLIDFKYFDNNIALKYSKVSNYNESVTSVLKEIKKQIPNNIYQDDLLKKGIIVRHLILPNNIVDSKNILKYLYNNYNNEIIYSIMNQYTILKKLSYEELNRCVSDNEYNEVIDYACSLGITNAYVQDGGTQEISFIPKFDLEGV